MNNNPNSTNTLPQSTPTNTRQGLLPTPARPPYSHVARATYQPRILPSLRITPTDSQIKLYIKKNDPSHPIPSKGDTIKFLADKLNILLTHISETSSGFTIKSDSSKDVDTLLNNSATLLTKNLKLIPPPKLLTRRTLLVRQLDKEVTDMSNEVFVDRFNNHSRNTENNLEILEKINLPDKDHVMKIICSNNTSAEHIIKHGFHFEYGKIASHQIHRQEHIDITVCYKCYSMDQHLTIHCPNQQVCSNCTDHHKHTRCPNSDHKFCVNCKRENRQYNHHTLALSCPYRKKIIQEKRKATYMPPPPPQTHLPSPLPRTHYRQPAPRPTPPQPFSTLPPQASSDLPPHSSTITAPQLSPSSIPQEDLQRIAREEITRKVEELFSDTSFFEHLVAAVKVILPPGEMKKIVTDLAQEAFSSSSDSRGTSPSSSTQRNQLIPIPPKRTTPYESRLNDNEDRHSDSGEPNAPKTDDAGNIFDDNNPNDADMNPQGKRRHSVGSSGSYTPDNNKKPRVPLPTQQNPLPNLRPTTHFQPCEYSSSSHIIDKHVSC